MRFLASLSSVFIFFLVYIKTTRDLTLTISILLSLKQDSTRWIEYVSSDEYMLVVLTDYCTRSSIVVNFFLEAHIYDSMKFCETLPSKRSLIWTLTIYTYTAMYENVHYFSLQTNCRVHEMNEWTIKIHLKQFWKIRKH